MFIVYFQDRLVCFQSMAREYRIVRLYKRKGRFNQPGGAIATDRGELALPCRACPHPSVNLPDGWEEAPADKA